MGLAALRSSAAADRYCCFSRVISRAWWRTGGLLPLQFLVNFKSSGCCPELASAEVFGAGFESYPFVGPRRCRAARWREGLWVF